MNTERLLAEYLDLGGQIEVVEGNLNVRAPKGTLSEALRESIRACKAELCALIGPDRRFCPISSQEQRLWFLHTQEGSGNAYNMDAAFRIEGPLDASALAAALKLIVQRHETLRTAYTVLDGKPYRAVMKACSPEPVFLDLPRLPREAAMKEAMIAGERFSGQSFDLTAPPLLRAQIIRVAPQTHFLFVVLHHIAADGASIQILVKELAEGYRAFVTDTAPDLPALTRSYSDCVTQNLVLFSQAIQGQLAYWARN